MMLIIALFVVIIGYRLEQKIYKTKWDNKLTVDMQFGKSAVAVGEPTILKETISNEKGMPIPSLEVKFSAPSAFVFENIENAAKSDKYYCRNMFSINGNQRISRALDLRATKRGYYTIKSADLLTKDYFMTRRCVKAQNVDAELLVYPEKINTMFFNPIYRNMMGEILIRQRTEIDPFMFRGIREYRPSDNMKFVNWKHSAQTGDILVNTYGSTASYQVSIILDGVSALAMDREFIGEKMISLASSMSERFLNDGMPVEVVSNWKYKRLSDEDAREVSTGSGVGKRHLETIDYQLALIDTNIQAAELKETVDKLITNEGKDRLLLVISANKATNIKELMDQYKSKGVNMYGIIAYTRREYENLIYGDIDMSDSRMSYWEVKL